MNILLRMIYRILIVAGILTGGVAAFVNLAPQFGASAKKERLARMEQSPQFENGKFKNAVPTSMDMGASDMTGMLKEYMKKNTNREPGWSIPIRQLDPTVFDNPVEGEIVATWFGHSAVILEMEGKRIFLDPMLGESASPVSFLGTKRFNDTLPLPFDQMPQFDAIVFSHDHYDHLDYPSVQKLTGKTERWIVPLGLGAHLEHWGVNPDHITEMDWWEELDVNGLTLACTPARHFSGRGITNRNTTLWSSWVLKGKEKNVYFSGDGGYWKGFAEIGEKYGPFDFTMMECGQYNKRWAQIHMMPEETVKAHQDVKGAVMMPIHWGMFNLSLHEWTEPVERMLAQAQKDGVTTVTPVVGERFVVGKDLPGKDWWEKGEKVSEVTK